MARVVFRLAAPVVAMFAASGAIAAPIITNGSFESGLTGWTTSGSGTTPGIGITVITTGGTNSTGYGDNVPVYDGTHAVFFVDDNANETLSQSVSLVGGTHYTLSFALFATSSGAANPYTFSLKDSVGASVLGTNLSSNVPVGVWTPYSYSFQAASTGNFTLAFNFVSGQTPSKDVILDAVNITAVPEPASWALMLMGFGGLGFAMRQRRKIAFA
ncbi:MAG: PEPxxWA-CTERM sorting domain-containing protein [Sphingobium sp.]|nr:PEPxxWA-CTERM sorting domain-containing protein [Sphingobium sp.]